jgi:hypothetical protein
MGVIGQAEVKHTGKSGNSDISQGVSEYTTVYIVRASSSGDGAMTVENAPGIPLWGNHYAVGNEFNINAVLKQKASKQRGTTTDGHYIWEVTCVHSTAVDSSKDDPTKDPIEWPLELDIDGEEYEDYQDYDLDGQEFANSAGEHFEASKIGTPKNYTVFSFTKYQFENPAQLAMTYQNTVNNSYFYGAAFGTLLCKKIRGSLVTVNGFSRWKTSYVFHYRDPYIGPSGIEHPQWTWYRNLLDIGEYYIGSDGKKKRVDDDGQQPKGGFKLDNVNYPFGGKLADGADACYNHFRVFEWKNFYLLNL